MAVETALLTIEEFERLTPPDDGGYELVEGELVKLTFPTPLHNLTASHIWRLLDDFVRENKLGRAFPDNTGYVLSRDPDTLRGPDVAFLRAERASAIDLRSNIPVAPDLAVEVISPSDTIRGMREKVDQFLAAGCRTVWVIDPEAREVQVFETDRAPRVLVSQDVIQCPDLLPGFSIKVADLFPER